MSLSLFALTVAGAAHTVSVEHHGQRVGVTYTARAEVRQKTVGAKVPNRMDMQRCRWTATLIVERRLDDGPALHRTIPSGLTFSGSAPGACVADRPAAERHLARNAEQIAARVASVTQADRPRLLAELDSVRGFVAKGEGLQGGG